MSSAATTAYVLLQDGARFDGIACGADEHAVGEIVFTTAMSGYQEAMTDPSYAGQLITFTFPMIGNYGVSEDAMESDRIHARAAIMRAAVDHEAAGGEGRNHGGWLRWLTDAGVPAITDVDTRALVRHIRDRGAMRGGVFPARVPETHARELIDAEPPMTGRDLAREVGTSELVVLPATGGWSPAESSPAGGWPPGQPPKAGEAGLRIALIDTGVKRSILHQLRSRGATVTLHPCGVSAGELLRTRPDAAFLANGPGDPGALDYVVGTVRELVGKLPVYGICLGHQLLCRAVGLETYKLPFGHHGANHPVKDLSTGRTEITSQNHGFAVLGPSGEARIEDDEPVRWDTNFGTAELTHINLYDRTVEGLTLRDVPGATVQYHPEAGPGPHDSLYLFDRFVDAVRSAKADRIGASVRSAGADRIGESVRSAGADRIGESVRSAGADRIGESPGGRFSGGAES
jgi:carbamoyl-phosphate synthase small subunit